MTRERPDVRNLRLVELTRQYAANFQGNFNLADPEGSREMKAFAEAVLREIKRRENVLIAMAQGYAASKTQRQEKAAEERDA